MTFTHVDKPFKIRGLELKNRVLRSAHATNIGNGMMSDDLIAYHEARARGGVALSIIEILSVHPSSCMLLHAFTPGIGEGYRKLVEACRPHGMKLFQQLWHGGHHGINADGGPPWSASDIASVMQGIVPLPMTQAMIDEVVQSYATAARQCEEWGLDGVEVHCAHGYLPGQFLSPVSNKRDDQYGGSLENRARFMLEVLAAVRAAVSDTFVVGVRVAPDYMENSLPPGDVLRVVQMAEARGLTDFVDVSAGAYQTHDKMIGGMAEPSGYEMPMSRPITHGTALPRIVAGRYRTLDDADLCIREGDADLVVITRGNIADPELVAKSLRGEGTRVRPCIGCNQGCVGGLMGPAHRMGCAVNPAVGFERTLGDHLLERVASPKKVLVVGGGVAGMEAARVAALRGHKVTLAEAGADLGGNVKIAAKAPTRHGLADIAIWQENELYQLGVDVRLSTYMEPGDIEAAAPDVVIVATGSLPRMDGIQLANPGEPITGFDRPWVLSSVDVFTDPGRITGKTALVVDDVGHYEALGVAEELLNRGMDVTLVTRHAAIGHILDNGFMTRPTLQRFSPKHFSAFTRSRVVSIDKGSAAVTATYHPAGDNSAHIVPADTVVFISHNRASADLAKGLPARIEVRTVGDARSPRTIEEAIREGYRAGATV